MSHQPRRSHPRRHDTRPQRTFDLPQARPGLGIAGKIAHEGVVESEVAKLKRDGIHGSIEAPVMAMRGVDYVPAPPPGQELSASLCEDFLGPREDSYTPSGGSFRSSRGHLHLLTSVFLLLERTSPLLESSSRAPPEDLSSSSLRPLRPSRGTAHLLSSIYLPLDRTSSCPLEGHEPQ